MAYDPAKKLLMIQIDGRDGLPYAGILLPNGEQREIRFVQREHLYWAEVPGLEEGEYKLLLRKEFEDFKKRIENRSGFFNPGRFFICKDCEKLPESEKPNCDFFASQGRKYSLVADSVYR